MFCASVRVVLLIFVHVLFQQCSTQTCSTTGRFPIYGTNCKDYVHCTYANGVYYSTKYYCPGTTYFNPRSQKCAASLICGDTICAKMNVNDSAVDLLDPNLSDNVSYIRCVRYNSTDVIPIYSTCPFTFNITNTTNNSGCCPYVTCV